MVGPMKNLTEGPKSPDCAEALGPCRMTIQTVLKEKAEKHRALSSGLDIIASGIANISEKAEHDVMRVFDKTRLWDV